MEKRLSSQHIIYQNKKSLHISYKTHPDLSCIKAIQMSSSIPLVFNNCVYHNELYADGAVSNNIPVNLVEKHRNPIIICISPKKVESAVTYASFVHKILHIIQKMIEINTHLRLTNAHKKFKKHIFEIKKQNSNVSFFTISKYDKLESFSHGYFEMKKLYTSRFIHNATK